MKKKTSTPNNVDYESWYIANEAPRSVVDDRQPFFKNNGKLLTVEEKMSQKAH